MSYLQTILWGIIIGLAELLPVSGSAHIAFLEELFGQTSARTEHALFYGLLDLALVIALLLSCRQDVSAAFHGLGTLLGKPSPRSRRNADRADQRLVLLIAVGLLPLLLDIALWRLILVLYVKPLFWALMLIGGGALLFRASFMTRGTKEAKQLQLSDAFLMGLGQAAAILPGVSGMGLMIGIGHRRGLQPAFALRFAFLLMIPTLFGSGVIRIIRALVLGVHAADIPAYLVGMVVCALTAFGAVSLLRGAVARRKINLFAFYCWGAAVFALFLFLIT